MQLVYIMFISNNYALFYLWLKDKLVKHQKVSKYYKNECSYRPFGLCNMAKIFLISHILQNITRENY